MDLDNNRGRFSPNGADENGEEPSEEINLNTSTASQEEEAAIEKRKEKLREEINEVFSHEISGNLFLSNKVALSYHCLHDIYDGKLAGVSE